MKRIGIIGMEETFPGAVVERINDMKIPGVAAEFVRVGGVIGNILQDVRIPGVHIAFGDPLGAYTGAAWNSTTHIDVVGTRFDVWVDDGPLMWDGEFLL